MAIEIKFIENFLTLDSISVSEKTCCFYARAIDERGVEAIKIFTDCKKYLLKYNKTKYILNIDNKEFLLENDETFSYIKSLVNDVDEIIIESTTLEFAENLIILYLLNAVKVSQPIKILYIEPKNYKEKFMDCNVLNNEYNLSTDYLDFDYIPPFATVIDSVSTVKAHPIIFIGFEEQRLGRLLNDDDSNSYSNDMTIILGLPAFRSGWENIAMQKNLKYFWDYKTDIRFIHANNPYETNKTLEQIFNNLQNRKNIVIPIGTKPNAIGACIFLINSKEKDFDVAVKYDFPTKAGDRSNGVGRVSVYNIGII